MLPVFNVTDQDGNKLRDEGILDYISKVDVMICLSAFPFFFCEGLELLSCAGGRRQEFFLGTKNFPTYQMAKHAKWF